MKNYIIIIITFLTFGNGYSQDIILDKIYSLQVKKDSFYNQGLFPSQIIWKNGKKIAEDNNIFFNGLTIYTLQTVKSTMSESDQTLIDSISFRTKKSFHHYKNRNGDITYNFYQVRPENPFPGLKMLPKYDIAKLPDDLDDTSILYLSENTSDSINQLLKQKMIYQSFRAGKIASTYKEYRSSLAYRSWFADKMKQDLDIVVNCNVLTWVFTKGLALDSVDMEAIDFISNVVSTNKHLERVHLISPHYQNTPVILYHIARLIAISDHPALNKLREKIITDLYFQLQHTNNSMEKVILLSSLYRLDKKVDFQIAASQLQRNMKNFYWFRANFISGRKFFIKRIFGNSRLLNYNYKSEAYYWSLILELKQLSGANIKTIDNQFIIIKVG